MRIAVCQVIWAVAVSCLTAAAQTQTSQPAETHRISGVIVNGVTGQPLSQARVLGP